MLIDVVFTNLIKKTDIDCFYLCYIHLTSCFGWNLEGKGVEFVMFGRLEKLVKCCRMNNM